MKRIQFLLLVMLVCSLAMADNIKRPTSFNYLRGCEAIENEKYEEGMHYLKQELKENPKNGYAWAWMMGIYLNNEDYSEVITSGQNALKLLPKKDKEYQAFVHSCLSKVYYYLDLKDKTLQEISTAIDLNPDNVDLRGIRAELYYEYHEYDKSNADFQEMIEKNPAEAVWYVGMGRNFFMQKQYTEAIELFTQAIKFDDSFSQAYAFRADCYHKRRDNMFAAQDYVKAIEIDDNSRAFVNMQEVNDTCYKHLAVLLKVNYMKDKDDKWLYYLGCLHESHENYKEAIEQFKSITSHDEQSLIFENIAQCYGELGCYNKALQYVEMGLEQDSTDTDMMIEKAYYLYGLGKAEEAILQIDKCIDTAPDYYYAYYRRGFIKDNLRDADGAIEDYTYSLVLEPDLTYAYMARGDMHMLKHDTISAMSDYRKAAEQDSIISEDSNCRQFALLMLGMRDSAEIHMNQILEMYPTSGNYYDAACLMSRMNKKEQALKYLDISFEKGFRDIRHIELDDDMDNIRNEETFKMLITKYASDIELEDDNEDTVSSHTDEIHEVTEIPFKKDGSMMMIQCTINELPLHFIFDTGASDVSISDVEANFMIKNGYLSKSDIIGKQNYSVADGSVHEGTVINLKQVRIGELVLKNVRASVVKSQRAPLLLGQSVFSRLGKIEIDNNEKVVKVTHNKK